MPGLFDLDLSFLKQPEGQAALSGLFGGLAAAPYRNALESLWELLGGSTPTKVD